MPDNDDDIPNIDEDEIKYFSNQNSDDEKPNIDEDDIIYFQDINLGNDLPNIDENEINFFPICNLDNEKPNINEKNILYVSIISPNRKKSNGVNNIKIKEESEEINDSLEGKKFDKEVSEEKKCKQSRRLEEESEEFKDINNDEFQIVSVFAMNDQKVNQEIELVEKLKPFISQDLEIPLSELHYTKLGEILNYDINRLINKNKSFSDWMINFKFKHQLENILSPENFSKTLKLIKDYRIAKGYISDDDTPEQILVWILLNIFSVVFRKKNLKLKSFGENYLNHNLNSVLLNKQTFSEPTIEKFEGLVKNHLKNNKEYLLDALESIREYRIVRNYRTKEDFKNNLEFELFYQLRLAFSDKIYPLTYRKLSESINYNFALAIYMNSKIKDKTLEEWQRLINLKLTSMKKKLAINAIERYRSLRGNIFDKEKRIRINKERYKDRILENDLLQEESLSYENLWDLELWLLFKTYTNTFNEYPNRGIRFLNGFIEWVKKNHDKFLPKIKEIQKNQEFLKLILNKVKNTVLPSTYIENLLLRIGLKVSNNTIIELTRINFNYDKNQLNNRFSGFPSKPSIITYENLLNNEVQNILTEYWNQTRNYPNYFWYITVDFQNWLIHNSDYSANEKMQLIRLCDLINEKQEIYCFIFDTVQKTNLSLKGISRLMRSMGINAKLNSIKNVALKNIFKDDISLYRKKFPKDLDKDIGNKNHNCISFLCKNFFENVVGIPYFSEIVFFENENLRIDGLLFNNTHFLQNRLINNDFLSQILKLPNLDNIKAILFDFTSEISNERIFDKIIKYQHNDVLLIIAATWWHETWKVKYNFLKPLPSDYHNLINNRDRIRILSPQLLSDFIGLKEVYLDYYKKIINYTHNRDLNSLILLENKIKEVFGSSTYNIDNKRDYMEKNGILGFYKDTNDSKISKKIKYFKKLDTFQSSYFKNNN